MDGPFINEHGFTKCRADVAGHLGSKNAAILYEYISRKVLSLGKARKLRKDGFVYETMEEITNRTALSRREQDGARAVLIKVGWMEVKKIRANGHATLHYKPLKQIVDKPKKTVGKSKSNAPNVQTNRVAKSAKLDAPNRQSNNPRVLPEYISDRSLLINKLSM